MKSFNFVTVDGVEFSVDARPSGGAQGVPTHYDLDCRGLLSFGATFTLFKEKVPAAEVTETNVRKIIETDFLNFGDWHQGTA